MLVNFFPISDVHIWAVRPILSEDIHQLTELSSVDRDFFQFIHHPIKQLETIASRLTVKALCSYCGIKYQGVRKNQFNKPELVGLPYSVSIAHTEGWAAASIHLTQSTGIDIEYPSSKIERVINKFLHPSEQKMITTSNLNLLCKFWTAKEALYKLYARKRLDFKEMIRIQPVGNELKGIITGDYETIYADLYFFEWDNAHVTVAQPSVWSPLLP
ncbi:MAG: 4'-phosphopantetheinyl transferase superfamily protein [Cytophagales bacterium]|nr:4'-phosphopantetheinyl transferase superfamily protein [Cytophagales bacterium]MDW8383289.1 4'-phosphopantetheinyl transferase superfamily protein [Flammeovirgaceae bacterium]